MIITLFIRVVYPLKNPSNACLSCLDNGVVVGMQFIYSVEMS